ncbi:MAG: YggS family pyridoxal phosphate-dependent enzyme [Candidatus Izemoplasmatales bacterium]|nr:YggS family pyridoxal phosphate-dependent enzyme [Hujiaoplasma nucleasis]
MLNLNKLNLLLSQMRDQKLIAVTKYVGDDEILALLDAGVNDFGENRVNVFLEKYLRHQDKHIHWHFIGHLQSKKVKKVINQIDYLHSLDRLSLADEINKHRLESLNCFIEVNISGEENKYGLDFKNVLDFFQKMKEYDKINVIGLMGMATHTSDEVLIRRQFDQLVQLKAQIKEQFNETIALSMGMSNDYLIAIDMGADYLRIGSLLYEED